MAAAGAGADCPTAVAQEVWCYSRRKFTAAHRGLWHLAHLRCSISADSSWGSASSSGEPVSVVHVQSGSVQEQATATAPGKPSLQDFRVATSTKVSFVSGRYHFVFSLDLSPSISVVDTSFKGFSTGTYLSDSLLPSLEDALRLLLARVQIGEAMFAPELFITVLAHGCPSFRLHVLQQSVQCTWGNLQEILAAIRAKLVHLFDEQASWLQNASEASSQKGPKGRGGERRRADGKRWTSSGRTPDLLPVDVLAKHNDLGAVLRNCLLALSTLSVPDATCAIVLLTDGVMCSKCNTLQFDSVLMHLNALDVALHIVQVGGGFAPWSALGMCSDLDLLHFLVSSTPGGVIFQDHHISSMLRKVLPDTAEATGARAPGEANRLQQAWLWRVSPLSLTAPGGGRTYSRDSFLSSVADRGNPQEDPDEKSYVDHLFALGCKMPPKFELTGLDDIEDQPQQPPQQLQPVTPNRPKHERRRSHGGYANGSASPQSSSSSTATQTGCWQRRATICSMMVSSSSRMGQHDWDLSPPLEESEAQFEACQYALPGNESQSQLYDDMSYSLIGVSLAHLVECRAREGFELKSTGGQEAAQLEFGLNFRPMFVIYYTLEVASKQEIRVCIKIRSPSPEYLKYRGPNKESELGEHQAKLDTFVNALWSVDHFLVNLTKAVVLASGWEDLRHLSAQIDRQELHHWFSIHRFEFMSELDPRALERLESWASTTLSPQRRYFKTLRWNTVRNMPQVREEGESGFRCRCCAPDGIPLVFVPNRLICGSTPGRMSQAIATMALPPCCLVDLLPLPRGAVSVIIASIGLCPHAERALLASVRLLLNLNVGAPLLGLAGEAPSRPRPLGRPGVLSAVVSGPAVAKIPAPVIPLRRAMRLRGHGSASFQSLVGMSQQKEDMSTTCQAMDGMGITGGSYFTFMPDWERLSLCLPNWSWRDSLKNVHSARIVYSIVQRLRELEGWHCLRNDDCALCYVKQLPLKPVGVSKLEGARLGPDAACGGCAVAAACEAKVIKVWEVMPRNSSGFDLIEGSEECSFRIEPVGIKDTNAGQAASRADGSDEAKVHATPKPVEVVLCPFPGESGEPSAPRTQGQSATLDIDKRLQPEAALPFCSLYYCMHLEVPSKRTERRILVTTMWLDAPPGMFDMGLLFPSPQRLQGPFCAGAHIPVGEVVSLNLEQGRAASGVRATATSLYAQWPAPVELLFYSADGLELRLLCNDRPGEESEAQAKVAGSGAAVDLVRAEARSLGGPAILSGVWVVAEANASDCGEATSMASPKECSAHDLGQLFASQVESRDAFAAATVGFMDHLGSVAEVKRPHGLPMRVHSDPGNLGNLQREHTGELPNPDHREHTLPKSLCGLMRSVQQRVRLQPSSMTLRQRDSFLIGLQRIDLVQQRVDFDEVDDGDADVKPGHYFFYFHHLRGGPSAHGSVQFSVVFVPLADSAVYSPLEVYISDGNLENFLPPSFKDPVVAAALSRDGGAHELHVVDEGEGVLSQRSMELAARIRVVHQRSCAEEVHRQLQSPGQRGERISDAELAAALEACGRAAAALPLLELLAASSDVGAEEVRSACDYLDMRLAAALDAHGFRAVEQGVFRDDSCLSLLCSSCASRPAQPASSAGPPAKSVCFLLVKVLLKAPDAEDVPASSPDLARIGAAAAAGGAVGAPLTGACSGGIGGGPSGSGGLFRAAFDAGGIQQALLEVHYMPHEASWASTGQRRATRVPVPRRLVSRQVGWDGLAALHFWDADVAERAARLSESLTAALYAAHADLLLRAGPKSLLEVSRLRDLFAFLSEGSAPAEYDVELEVAESAQLGLDFDDACFGWRGSCPGLVVAGADRCSAASWNAAGGRKSAGGGGGPGGLARIEPGDRIVAAGNVPPQQQQQQQPKQQSKLQSQSSAPARFGSAMGGAGGGKGSTVASIAIPGGEADGLKLEKLASEAQEAASKKKKLALKLRKPAMTHVHEMVVPVARPQLYNSSAHAALVEELIEVPEAAGARLVHLANLSSKESIFLWHVPLHPRPGGGAPESEDLQQLLHSIGCKAVSRFAPAAPPSPPAAAGASPPSEAAAAAAEAEVAAKAAAAVPPPSPKFHATGDEVASASVEAGDANVMSDPADEAKAGASGGKPDEEAQGTSPADQSKNPEEGTPSSKPPSPGSAAIAVAGDSPPASAPSAASTSSPALAAATEGGSALAAVPGAEEAAEDEVVPFAEAPPFWAFVVLPMRYDGAEPFVMAKLHLLFTPVFWSSCIQGGGGPPAPEPYTALCEDTFRRAAVRMNQKLLLKQMAGDFHLSELLHRELRDDGGCSSLGIGIGGIGGGGNASHDYDNTPFNFLARAKSEDDEVTATRSDVSCSMLAAAKTPGSATKPTSPGPKQFSASSRRRQTMFSLTQDDMEEAEVVCPTEDPRFVELLPSPGALDCPLQGTVRVNLVPCLHHFKMISWLGGGDAEPSKSASTKVSFQRQKTGQHNEALSIFAKSRLQTRCVDAVWLAPRLRSSGTMPGDASGLHFVRPRYVCGSGPGCVDLCMDFFGLRPLSPEDMVYIERQLAAQLEKLAIVKLQLHTLDRQQTNLLRIAVLDFLRPPGSPPGQSMLLAIPPVEQMLPYTQFIRRALLGLLEPCTIEAHRIEEVDCSAGDERSSSLPALQLVGMQVTMRFLYKRRHIEQVITDVRQYEKRGPQRRDKVSEKLLQFQGRIGDGIAFIELFFISGATGRVMEDMPGASASVPQQPAPSGMEVGGPMHLQVQCDCIARQQGRFEHLHLPCVEEAATEQLGGEVGSYLLLDIWHRALGDEHAKLLAQEISFAADQALREYRLQSSLRRVEGALEGAPVAEEELQTNLEEFRSSSLRLMDQMPHQHLSSLLTHSPPHIPVGPPDMDVPGHLPPWAFMKTVEGLHELLLNADKEVLSSCVVTLESAAAGESGAANEEALGGGGGAAPQRCHWFDVESDTRSLLLGSVCRAGGCAPDELELTPQALLDSLAKPSDHSLRFTFMWGPTMRAWHRRLSRGAEQKPTPTKPEDRDVFVYKALACDDRLLRRKYRLDQLRVEKGGPAGLKKHTLQEWREADDFLKVERLDSPFLVVVLDQSGAKIRGVRIDTTTMLRVQYYLQSQFLWLWARTQLLRDICSCELRLDSIRGLPDQLRREFPWIFDRGAARDSARYTPSEDHSTVDESVASVGTIDLDDEAPYLFFGLTRRVMFLMIHCEIVPDPGEDSFPSDGTRERAQTEAPAGAVAHPSTASAGGDVGGRRASFQAHKLYKNATNVSVASSLRDVPVSEGPAAASSSSTQMESLHRLAPGVAGAVRRGLFHQPRAGGGGGGAVARAASATVEANEASIKFNGADFWPDGDDPSDSILDSKDILVGESLVSSALESAAADGRPCSSSLADPLLVFGPKWLEASERRMRQYRRKKFIASVMQEWTNQGVVLVDWARQALDAHEARADADEQLEEMGRLALQDRLGRLALQDPNIFEAETLILSLIHQSAVPLLSKPFMEELVIGPGLESPAKSVAGRGAPPAPPKHSGAEAPVEAGFEGAVRRNARLSEKLCEATPLLTLRQRFLSSLLDAFARPAPSRRGEVATGHWRLVFCLENPLPWQGQGADMHGQANSHGVLLIRPQTLLLHRWLSHDPPTALLAEVACRLDHRVRVEVFAQGAKTQEAMQVSEDFLASIRDFCFDFRLRSLMDSYRALSNDLACPVVDALIRREIPIEVPHRERGRNLIVQGEVSSRPLAEWFRTGVRSLRGGRDIVVLDGVKAKHLVQFIHSSAKHYGFECAGEAHEPLLAMSLQDSGFTRAIRERARAMDLLRSSAGHQEGAAPVAQGLRCVLFACPQYSDVARPPVDGVSGELGFSYISVLLDSAWCTPSRSSGAGMSPEHRDAWDGVAATLRAASEEALAGFAELTMASLVAMRRFNALWRAPQRTRALDIQEVLADCGSHVDLCTANECGEPLASLRSLPSMEWQRLGPYLKDAFRGHCVDLLAALRPNPPAPATSPAPSDPGLPGAPGAGVQGAERGFGLLNGAGACGGGLGISGAGGGRECERHLFIVTTVGAPQQFTHVEDRHYAIIHLIWDSTVGALQEVWLHSSRKLPHLGVLNRAVFGLAPGPAAHLGLRTFVDDLPAEDRQRIVVDVQLGVEGDSDSPRSTGFEREVLFQSASLGSMLDASNPPPPSCIDWGSVPEVCLLVQRFITLLMDFAFTGRH